MYMRGDYYSGDYYSGDPGLFSGIARFVGGVFKATPVGQAVGAAVGAVRAIAGPKISAGTNPGSITASRQASGAGSFSRTTVGPGGILYSRTEGQVAVDTGVPASMGGGGGGPGTAMVVRRTHPNKSTYVTRGGGTSRWPQEVIVHYRGTEAVTTRRMNVANPRALRRSLRRVAGFAKLTKRVRSAVSRAASAVGVRRHAKALRRR